MNRPQMTLGQNLNNGGGTVNDGTYIGFIVLMLAGAILALSLSNAKNIIRNDGSRIIIMKHPTWKSEFIGMWEVLLSDWYIVFLFPMFFASNWFYTYHFQAVNTPQFTLRTRSLNGVLYWLAQIIGSGTFGYALDSKFLSRSMRAKVGTVALFCLTMGEFDPRYSLPEQLLIRDQSFGAVDSHSRKPTNAMSRPTSTIQSKPPQPRRGSTIGRMADTSAPCSYTSSTDSSTVSFHLHSKLLSHRQKLGNKSHTLILICSCMANKRLLVHGFPQQQLPQTCQLRWILQGYSICGKRHCCFRRREES